MIENLRPYLMCRYGQLLTIFNRNQRALEIYQEVARAYPRYRRAWSCAGFLLAEQQRFEPAIKAFERALALDPLDASTCFNLGFVLQGVGRHQDAIERFQQAVDTDRNLDRAWYGMGLSLAQLGRCEEAAQKLEAAARLQPFNPYAGYELAGVRFKLGQHDKVRAEYERVKGFDPKVSERIRLDFGVRPE
ncbi:MAG: tetratricopeptide repeat protein [Burkholderiales bacterium]